MPRKDNTHIWLTAAPKEGWKPRTYYVVEVQFNANNPKHRCILYTGFLNGSNDTPGGYSGLFSGGYGNQIEQVESLYSITPISEIKDMVQ